MLVEYSNRQDRHFLDPFVERIVVAKDATSQERK